MNSKKRKNSKPLNILTRTVRKYNLRNVGLVKVQNEEREERTQLN